MAPCGVLAAPDFERVRSRVKKFDDIAREFAEVGVARVRRAEAARQAGHEVSEREHSFIASILFGQAQWPIFGGTPESVLTLVGQDGRIRRTPWSDRPAYHHGLPEVVLGDHLPEVVLGE